MTSASILEPDDLLFREREEARRFGLLHRDSPGMRDQRSEPISSTAADALRHLARAAARLTVSAV